SRRKRPPHRSASPPDPRAAPRSPCNLERVRCTAHAPGRQRLQHRFARSKLRAATPRSPTMLLAVFLFASLTPLALAATSAPPMPDRMRVAFVLTDGATMIDFAGPWEVFQDVMI